ncbi:MAG: DUF2393 family protein [Acidobacteriaceae bacterium]
MAKQEQDQQEPSGSGPNKNTDAGRSSAPNFELPSFDLPQEPSQSNRMPLAVWIAAALLVVVAIAVGVWSISAHKVASSRLADATTIYPLDPYAANLPISGIVMSEAGSLAGGKLTYIDGHIRNTGSRTIDGVTVQTIFRNDVGELPQVETLSLMLIRTHEPYVDLQPVSASPLKPGDDREFRLIFERVTPNWNQQYPEIHVVRVAAR